MKKGGTVNRVTYEVLDIGETKIFGDPQFDWSSAFGAGGSNYFPSKAVDGNVSDDEIVTEMEAESTMEDDSDEDRPISEQLRKLSQELVGKEKSSRPSSKKKTPTTMKTQPTRKNKTSPRTSNRISIGFSLRQQVQARGPNPVCRACKKPIEKNVKCLRHCFKERPSHKYNPADQFHCYLKCVRKIREKYLAGFLAKKWTDKEVLKIAAEIEREKSDGK